MQDPLVEIARSFSLKKNLGNYESTEAFCSIKRSCNLSEVFTISAELADVCEQEVLASIEYFLKDREGGGAKSNRRAQDNPAGLDADSNRSGAHEPESDAPMDTSGIDTGGHPVGTREAQKAVAQRRISEELDKIAEFNEHLAEDLRQAVHSKSLLPSLPEQAVDAKKEAKAEAKKLSDDILLAIPTASKDHLREFFLGWFDPRNGKSLPRDPSLYLIPSRALWQCVISDEGKISLLCDPKRLGSELKFALAEAEKNGHPVDFSRKTEDAPTVGSPDSDIISDPLMERFGWKNFETAVDADALMKKWKLDADAFEKHLFGVNMLKLPELDLDALMKLLWHDVEAYRLWKWGEDRGVSMSDLLVCINTCLGAPISRTMPSSNVSRQIKKAMEARDGVQPEDQKL